MLYRFVFLCHVSLHGFWSDFVFLSNLCMTREESMFSSSISLEGSRSRIFWIGCIITRMILKTACLHSDANTYCNIPCCTYKYMQENVQVNCWWRQVIVISRCFQRQELVGACWKDPVGRAWVNHGSVPLLKLLLFPRWLKYVLNGSRLTIQTDSHPINPITL